MLSWILLSILLLVSVCGIFIPLIPCQILIILAATTHYFLEGTESGVGITTFIVLITIAVVSQVIETLSGSLGTKWSGGGKWGIIGASIGLIFGLFFPPLGFLFGPLIGAFLGEKLFGKKTFKNSITAGVGSTVGTLSGLLIRGIVALLMICYLLLDIFLWKSI